jgi:hypothetical protein
LEAIVSPLLGFTVGLVTNTTLGFIAGLVVVIVGLVSVWIGATIRTPYCQRNEARQIVDELTQPRLTIAVGDIQVWKGKVGFYCLKVGNLSSISIPDCYADLVNVEVPLPEPSQAELIPLYKGTKLKLLEGLPILPHKLTWSHLERVVLETIPPKGSRDLFVLAQRAEQIYYSHFEVPPIDLSGNTTSRGCCAIPGEYRLSIQIGSLSVHMPVQNIEITIVNGETAIKGVTCQILS